MCRYGAALCAGIAWRWYNVRLLAGVSGWLSSGKGVKPFRWMLGKWLGSILGCPWPPPYPTPKAKPAVYRNPYTESWPFPEKFPYPFPCGSPSRAMAVFKNFPAATVPKQKSAVSDALPFPSRYFPSSIISSWLLRVLNVISGNFSFHSKSPASRMTPV